jgi:hypothetical protein
MAGQVENPSRQWGLAGLRLAAAALLIGSGEAHSAPETPPVPSFVLTYVQEGGAERCPSAEAFRKSVAQHLGHDPFSDTGAGRLSVQLRREGEGLVARLTLRRDAAAAPGERVLESKDLDCVVLASTLALVASLDIEAQEQLVATTPPPTLVVEQSQPTPPGPGAGFLAFLGPLVVFLAAPSTTIGGVLGAEVRWPRASLGLEARADRFASGPIPGGSVETSQVLGSLVGCSYWSSLGACALVAAGVESAKGIDVPGARSDHGPFIAPGARLLWEIPLSRTFALRAQGDVLIPVVRSSLRFNDTEVWISPPVSLALGLILEARIL